MSTRLLILSLFLVPALSCGVKGKPLAPLQPIPLGDGTLASKKNEKERKKKNPVTAPKEETPAEETSP